MTVIENTLQQLVEQTLEISLSYGIQLHLNSPKLGIQWNGAVGFTDRSHNTARQVLTPLHPMRIASTTKTFIAAAILRLWEQQRLVLDSSISKYIAAEHADIIQKKGYALERISTRQLLAHTSGLFDYADSGEFFDAVGANPQYHWTRTEQLQLAMECGEPYGTPGEVFRYSDTGYILLGEIIERISGQSLGLALRGLLHYEQLGLHSTWLEITEPAPANLPPRVHQYEGNIDVYDLNGTFDIYGGGGLISTVGDMARFFRGLFEGKVFSSPDTLTQMLAPVPAKCGGPDYGIWKQVPGTYRLGIDAGENNAVYSHRGHFGTLAAYVPELDLAVGLNIGVSQNGPEDHRLALLNDILKLF